MENSHNGQEKLAAALSAIVFFIPMLMDVKTPFVIKYMKQGFIINLAELVLAAFSTLIFGFMGLVSLINFVCVVLSFWLAFQAFSGKEYVISLLMQNAEKIIQSLGIGSWFSTK